MKKFLSFIFLLSLSFAFFSCGGDDDNPTPPEPKPEPFVWGGDWNDPDDAAYKPEYEGKYNPIQGLWKSDADKDFGLLFTEDFKCYQVFFTSNGGYVTELFRDKYIINDKAYEYELGNIWIYKMEKEKFWNIPHSYLGTGDEDWRGYTKVEKK